MSLPTGTVTFLFTDIEGSTYRWERYPAEMVTALERHDLLLRETLETHGAYIFKTFGDAFCAAFQEAPAAVQAAAAAQRRLLREEWPFPEGIPVRIALHSGEAQERDGDYFGPTVNRVARLLAAGHGSQVLLSGTVRDLLQEGPTEGISFLGLGERRLKDLVQPERIYQLSAPGLPSVFPPLRTLDRSPASCHPPGGATDDGGVAQRLLRELGSLEFERRRAAVEELVGQGRAAVTLLCLALSEPRREARRSAAEALGRLGDGEAVPFLIEALEDEDPHVRQKVAEALGRIPDTRSVPALCARLRDLENGPRGAAAQALGLLGDASAAPVLRELLRDESRFVRGKAVEALAALGESAAPHVEQELLEGSLSAGSAALEALGRIGDAGSLPVLLRMLESEHTVQRRETVETLGALGDARAVPSLCRLIKDPDTSIRRATAISLGRIGNAYAAAALSEALSDSDLQVQVLAGQALARLGAGAAPVLAELLRSEDRDQRLRARHVLVEIGPAAVLALCAALDDGNPMCRKVAAEALAELARRSPAPILRAALPRLRRLTGPWSQDDEWTRRAYGTALTEIETRTAPFRDLPTPSGQPARDEAQLPRPAVPLARPDELPLPSSLPLTLQGVAAEDSPTPPDPNAPGGSLLQRIRELSRRLRP